MNKKSEFHPVKLILLAVILFLGLKSLIIDIKRVAGHSMEPTIRPGEFVLINKLAYGLANPFTETYLIRWRSPHYGEIVAANHPAEKKIIIKRVAASEGTTFTLAKDHLIIDAGVIPSGSNNLLETLGINQVPDDKTLIIGDNYMNSIDSRSFGFVSNGKILGKVIEL